jgi:hypothetical protein
MINMAHTRQGVIRVYNVAPFNDSPRLAA